MGLSKEPLKRNDIIPLRSASSEAKDRKSPKQKIGNCHEVLILFFPLPLQKREQTLGPFGRTQPFHQLAHHLKAKPKRRCCGLSSHNFASVTSSKEFNSTKMRRSSSYRGKDVVVVVDVFFFCFFLIEKKSYRAKEPVTMLFS